MKSYDVVINHKGHISLDIIDDILHHLKLFLQERIDDKTIRKRVYSLSVECLDNIFKHSDLIDEGNELVKSFPPRFIVEKIAESFMIHTGNIILNENVELVIKSEYNSPRVRAFNTFLNCLPFKLVKEKGYWIDSEDL